MAGDMLALTKALDVEPGDLVWRNDDLYRCYEVDRDRFRHRVTLRLEASRHGDWNVRETTLVPIEVLS